MIPSSVPDELKKLTQIEEMLIARALPIMRVTLSLVVNVVTRVIVLTYHRRYQTLQHLYLDILEIWQ